MQLSVFHEIEKWKPNIGCKHWNFVDPKMIIASKIETIHVDGKEIVLNIANILLDFFVKPRWIFTNNNFSAVSTEEFYFFVVCMPKLRSVQNLKFSPFIYLVAVDCDVQIHGCAKLI